MIKITVSYVVIYFDLLDKKKVFFSETVLYIQILSLSVSSTSDKNTIFYVFIYYIN